MKQTTNRSAATEGARIGIRWLAFVATAVLLAGLFFVNSFAQQDLEQMNRFLQAQHAAADRIFREGRDFIGEEDWEEAEEKFRSFVSQYSKEKNLDAALYWLAFTQIKQEKYHEAEKQLKRLLKEFPRSNWADDANVLRVQIAEHVGNSAIINQTLNEDDVEVKIVALQSLFDANPQRGLAYVTEMMKPDSKANPRLKEAGIELLRRYGGKQAVGLLLEIIRNQPDQKLRIAAIQTLGRTGDESALPLLKDLVNTSTDEEVRKAAVFAISRYDGVPALGLLTEIARSGSSVEVRKDAIFWLSHRGDEAVDELLKIYDADRNSEIRKQIVFTLKRIGSPRAIGKLYEIAQGGDDAEVRQAALHWIGETGDERSVSFLIQRYDTEKDPESKQQIIFALSRTGDKRAVQKMIDIARRDPSVDLRKQAIFWLGRSSDPEAQKFLEDLLK